MARNSVRELLEDITAASRGARFGINGKGRLKRTPDFTKPKVSSTRPKSDRGVTFHFAHKTISKRGDVSDSQKDATSAPSHQSYIERLEAVELSDSDLALISQVVGLAGARDRRHEGKFSYPELVIEPGRESFGTIGSTKSERADFWRTVEISEGRTARVQSRIIAELPHEVSQQERAKIAMGFCRSFSDRELPFWATIHAPTKSNDKRNYHLHIAYYDRPAARSDSGEWDFAAVRTRVKPNRVRVEHRPFKQNKTAEIRGRDWVRALRYEFADASNIVLQSGDHEKRLDPRSYRESGIKKSPTEHLGFKSNALEKFGLETTRGRRNARKEFEWRIEASVAPWDNLIGEHDATLLFANFTADEAGWALQKKTKEKLLVGREIASKATKMDLLGEAVALRIGSRKAFLDDERKRVARNEKLRTAPDSQQAISLIDIETAIIENRLPDIQEAIRQIESRAMSLRQDEEKLWDELSPLVKIEDSRQHAENFPGVPQYPVLKDADADTDQRMHQDTDPFNDGPLAITDEDLFGGVDEQQESPINTSQTDPAERSMEPQSAPASWGLSELTPTIPGSLLVPEVSNRSQLNTLNETLMSMTNRQVRISAITSRDASEFLDPGEERHQAKRGWIILRAEAEKRGVDLETGLQDLTLAKDPERALLHRDQGQETVLEIREEVVRVMSR